MSENSELIHRHLQPRLVALLVALREKRALLWQIASYLICCNSSAVAASGSQPAGRKDKV